MSVSEARFERRRDYIQFSLGLLNDYKIGELELSQLIWRLEDAALSAKAAQYACADEFYEVWSNLETANSLRLIDLEQGFVRKGFDPDKAIAEAIAEISAFLSRAPRESRVIPDEGVCDPDRS